MRNKKEIVFKELGVSARSKQEMDIGEDPKNRITLIVTDVEDTIYTVHISRGNAKFLVDRLVLAIDLAK